MTDFQILALPRELFEAEFASAAATWLDVDADPGYPCRVSLQDARVGERVLALSYLHHDVDSPYRATGPIFVREQALTRVTDKNEIPRMLEHRQLSLRGYDANAMMIAATVTHGSELRSAIQEMFADSAVDYLHVHNAGPGCFNCAVKRA
ncbi:MAG: DUF1203 domain-containing protein [Gammaproteobacteria bacterium]|nr:DUF1203 domain-containing protein [Gammaproteobacteria bacterium]NNF60178.1 DUF1203 domain-containing protein [Gammaproteobacteria bacterium]NNM21591.1 DUF1203 domain-containing protein [Gammaproteobacteria bacterium]